MRLRNLFAGTLMLLLVCTCGYSQSKPSYLQLKDTQTLDFRSFGAKAEVGFDNAPALALAATYITSCGGNVTLAIPEGTYEVVPGGEALASGARDLWSAFDVADVDNVTIRGMAGAKFTSSLDMGSSSTEGQCMWLFEFTNCHNVTIDNLIVDIAVTATPDTLAKSDADPAVCKLAAIVNANASMETVEGLTITNCDFKIHCANGNGAKADYEFITVYINGDWGNSFPYTDVLVDNCTFRDGQGPELWFWFTRGAIVQNSRWLDSGGVLYPIRCYPACADITVDKCYFRRKAQPNETVGIGHNYTLYVGGGSGGATDTDKAAKNIHFINNIVVTLTGQVAFFGGGDQCSFEGNSIVRPDTATDTFYAGAVTLGNSAYGEGIGTFKITGNSFRGLERPALYLNGSATNIISSDNSLIDCDSLVYASSLSWLKNVSFTSDMVSSCSNKVVQLATLATNTVGVSISGCTFEGNANSCIYAATPTANEYNIMGCLFRNNTAEDSVPIVYGLSSTIVATGNTFRSNGWTDLYLNSGNASTYTRGSSAVGNKFEGGDYHAIFSAGNYNTITNNTIINCNQLETAGGSGILVATSSYYINVSGNTIYDQNFKSDYGIWMASVTSSLANDNLTSHSGAISNIATGTSGVETSGNAY